MKIITSFLLIIIIFSFFSMTANATDTGTLTINALAGNTNNYRAIGGATTAVNWSNILFYTAGYNYIQKIDFYCVDCTSAYDSASSTFSFSNNGNLGSGIWTWNKLTKKIIYTFATDSYVISSPIMISFNSPSEISKVDLFGALGAPINPSLTNPVLFTSNIWGVASGATSPLIVQTSNRVSNNYTVTYPNIGGTQFFSLYIDKTGATVQTQAFANRTNATTYISESAPTTTSFNASEIMDLGLVVAIKDAAGNYDSIVINSTTGGGETGTTTITTDKATYQRGDNIAITATNNEPGTIYLTAYGPTGIMFDILWNTQVLTGQTKAFNKIILGDYPIGDYQITAATTSSYVPIVAIAYFNISLPGNTTNELGLLWDQNLYLVGNTGIINSQGNFNTTELTITSPSGTTTNFNYPANATNSTAITLNEDGIWSGKLVDSGNASNYIISNTTVSAGDPNDNQTFERCKTQATYICFDHPTYQRGQNFKLEWKRTLLDIVENTRLIILNPSQTRIINQTINGTFYTGSFSGYFSNTAELGTYYARLEKPNGEIITEGYTAVEGQAVTPIPTPTTGTPGMTNQAANLLNIFTYMAFYGMVIFIGIFYSAIKLMTAHGAQVNGSALVIIMAIVATMEALIGLFDPYKLYIIVITWIFAAIYFRQTRATATGES